jgi:hypothetical protein
LEAVVSQVSVQPITQPKVMLEQGKNQKFLSTEYPLPPPWVAILEAVVEL